jgi:hypothetical protein
MEREGGAEPEKSAIGLDYEDECPNCHPDAHDATESYHNALPTKFRLAL